jgi:hypothetical protein
VPQLARSREVSIQTPPHRERPTPQALPASGAETETAADGTQNPVTQMLAEPQSALVEHSSSEVRPQSATKPAAITIAAQPKAVLEAFAQPRMETFIEPHNNVTRTPMSAQMRGA